MAGGEGDVQPGQPPGQYGPTVALDHVSKPGGTVSIEGGETELLKLKC